jgi:DNA-directed RNA polymerase specialized sigma24 family protein
MNKTPLTPDSFDKLLRWLEPDRDKAGAKYEKIRLGLIRFFSCRGCSEAEDLADKTFNVVVTKIDWLLENYVGEPTLYFYGVAKKVLLEPKTRVPTEPLPLPDKSEIEEKCSCLEQCLEQELSPPERELLFRYHEKEKGEKIRIRKQIAKELGISINALRIRVHHLHSSLRPCVDACLQHLLEI